MLPHRLSFLIALFGFFVCCAALHSASTSSTFSPVSNLSTSSTSRIISSLSSSSSSGTPSNTFFRPLITSSTSSFTSTTPSATPTTSSSHSHVTTSTTPTETSTTRPSTTSTSTSSSSSQTPSLTSSTSSTSSLPSSPTSYDAVPATTLIVPDPASFTTSTSSSDDTGPTSDASSSSATSSTPFWDNKSAVAGIFVTAGLASLVLVAGVAYMVFRRHQQRKMEHAMEAENFVDQGDIWDSRDASPAPSMSQVTTPTYTEAIVSRDVHYGANYMDFAGQGSYGLDHLPGVVPFNSAGRAGWGPTYPVAGNVPYQPSVGPSTAGNPVLSNSRHPPGRDSVATHISVDSFYCGIARGN